MTKTNNINYYIELKVDDDNYELIFPGMFDNSEIIEDIRNQNQNKSSFNPIEAEHWIHRFHGSHFDEDEYVVDGTKWFLKAKIPTKIGQIHQEIVQYLNLKYEIRVIIWYVQKNRSTEKNET